MKIAPLEMKIDELNHEIKELELKVSNCLTEKTSIVKKLEYSNITMKFNYSVIFSKY